MLRTLCNFVVLSVAIGVFVVTLMSGIN